MSEKLPNKLFKKHAGHRFSWRMLIGLPAWVFVSFAAANIVIIAGFAAARETGLYLPTETDPVLETILAAVVYTLSLACALGLPWLVKRRATTRRELGLTGLPTWLDILLTPAAFVVYLIVAALILFGMSTVFPWIDLEQAQDVGFNNLVSHYQYLLAFVTLVVVAPIAEEVLFRGYLYGKLKKYTPVWLALLVTSVLFGFLHGQWNVGINVFALSLVLCGLREITGTIWAGILLHMLKNGVAFYFLFINPSLLHTLGG